MKKNIQNVKHNAYWLRLCVLLAMVCLPLLNYGQTTATENFEGETVYNVPKTTFSQSGINFETVGTKMRVLWSSPFGASSSDIFYETISGVSYASQNVGGFRITNAATSFKINSFACWTSNDIGLNTQASGTVTFIGTKPDGTTVSATRNIVPTGPDGNGWQTGITFAGTALDNVQLTKLEFQLPSNLLYFSIDNINFTTAAIASSQYSINDVSALESNSGTNTHIFTVSRTDGTAAGSVTLNTADGTATAGTDYVAISNQVVNFPINTLNQNVSVTVNGDASIEPNETYFVNLSAPVGGTLLDAQGIGTILDDDAVTETFENETSGGTTFSQNGLSFSTTQDLTVYTSNTFGSGSSNYWLHSGIGNGGNAGSVGKINVTTSNRSFKLVSVDAWTSNNDGTTFATGTVRFIGTKLDGTTVQADKTVTPTNNTGTGWQQNISFTGTALDNQALKSLEFQVVSGINYISIDNFKFSSQILVPEIDVVDAGNNAIVSGSTSVSLTNNTQFGNVCELGSTSASKTYTIKNTDLTGTLTLSGTPKVSITGTDASSFTVTTQPATTVAPSGSTTFTVAFDPTSAGTKNATISIANDDSNENPYTFAIQGTGNSIVTPTFNQVAAFCSGASVSALPTNSTNSISGTWSPTLSNTTSGTYTFTPTAGQCTSGTTTMSITVNPIPVVDKPSDQILCANASTPLVEFSSSTAGTSYSWTNNTPSIGLGAAGSGLGIASFTATNSTSDPVIATISVTPSANGCEGTPVDFTITVNPIPVVDKPADQFLCANISTSLVSFSSATVGATFNWINDKPSIGLLASGEGNIAAFTGTNSTSTPIKATISVTPSANGCVGLPLEFTITVNPIPVVDKPADQILCANASTSLVEFSSSTAGTSYDWTNNTPSIGLGAAGFGNILAFTATNSTSVPVIATISVTPSANGCVGLPVDFTITVNPIPVPEFDTIFPLCKFAPFALNNLSNNGINGTWSPLANDTVTTTYTFTPNMGECASTITKTVVYKASIPIAHVNNAVLISGDGLTWATAFKNLQEGINACGVNQVWVATGTYLPTEDVEQNVTPLDPRDKTFLMKDQVSIYGGFPNTGSPTLLDRDFVNYPTVLSGDFNANDITTGSGATLSITNNSENAYHVVSGGNDIINGLDLNGLIIQGGNANNNIEQLSYLNLPVGPSRAHGGAIFLANTGIRLEKCVLRNNVAANNGGAIYCFDSEIRVLKSVIESNAANNGGGIYLTTNSSSTIRVSVLANNFSTTRGGALMAVNNSPSGIWSSSLVNNHAGTNGGGIFGLNNSSSSLMNSVVWANTGNGTQGIFGSSSTTFNVTYSNIQGASPYFGTGNILVSPGFVNQSNMKGADGKWLTLDDGLMPKSCSQLVDLGASLFQGDDILDKSNVDVANIGNDTKDIGAYENQSPSIYSLLMSSDSLTQNVSNNLFANSNCGLAVTILPIGGSTAVSNNVKVKVNVDANSSPNYLRRHYEITPSVNPNTATARVTLYFTQADFDVYNAVNTMKLPTGPTDSPNKINLKIVKFSGVSTNGAPSGYSSTPVTIIPDTSKIVWNGAYWSVTFDVAGFSGFFVNTGSAAPLSTSLLAFEAKKITNKSNLLTWKVASPLDSYGYEVEKSANGIGFEKASFIKASSLSDYRFVDNNIGSGNNYYRLKLIDLNGEFKYSRTVYVENGGESTLVSQVYPNPSTTKQISLEIESNEVKTVQTEIVDIIGLQYAAQDVSLLKGYNKVTFDLKTLPSKMYFIRIKDQTGKEFVRKFVLK